MNEEFDLIIDWGYAEDKFACRWNSDNGRDFMWDRFGPGAREVEAPKANWPLWHTALRNDHVTFQKTGIR